ncbi:hypothetical protein GH714_013027 [Hevea brasiliensis]|uniref:HAT C-terminal dimerisation domain-containing protein n=1 Tax=Hevea brasiliensis TaxID=3981 RepID=A0A6A6M4X2_HEVBR|nr:hypothetical protein GH714_013027 [Hevea brasiliensis]
MPAPSLSVGPTPSIDKSLSKDSQCAFSALSKPQIIPPNMPQPDANEIDEGNMTQSAAHPILKSRSGVWVHFEKLINSKGSEIGLKSKSSSELDCPTRWNSTYLMLESALTYQKAFDMLEDADNQFQTKFRDELPSEFDWHNAMILCKFLKKLYNVTSALYPRHKLNYIKAKYIIYYSESEAQLLVDRVVNALKEILNEYMRDDNLACMGDSAYSQNVNVEKCNNAMMEEDEEIDDCFVQMEEPKLASQSELDRYLKELLEKFTKDFDLLLWWKVNSVRYPILSKLANDIWLFSVQLWLLNLYLALEGGLWIN